MSKKIDYKYNEDVLIKQFKEYVDKTYDQHYSQNKYQATEFIIDGGHGEGFCIGNMLKYAQRYGKKNGYNRADLLKVLHYALIETLYVHDTEQKILEEYIMKISESTLEVLQNFSSINNGITVQRRNEIKTISPMKNIFGRATLSDNFTSEFSVYDLPEFLATVIVTW